MITSPPNWTPVGQRIQAARVALGHSVQTLAHAAKLPVPELVRMEAGQHEFGPGELARIAAALELAVDWFLTESPPAVRSLRADRVEGPRVARTDLFLDILARDVDLLRSLGFLAAGAPGVRPSAPDTIDATERVAQNTRTLLGVDAGPLLDLDRVMEKLGVHTFCVRLGLDEPDGAYASLDEGGVVILNGAHPPGRRRFTLAHELGHHIFQDQYSTDWLNAPGSPGTERLVNAFAAHLLLPRASVVARWQQLTRSLEPRMALLSLAVEYRVSWSVACNQCARFRLLDDEQYATLSAWVPNRADHMEMGLRIDEEMIPPSLSPGFSRAVLAAYRKNRIAGGRAIEMLRGTLQRSELPTTDDVPLQAYLSELEVP